MFRITGGVRVAPIGYQMLHGDQSSVHQPDEEDLQDSADAALSVAITPLAIPIVGGRGTIATAMSFAATGGVRQMTITIAAFGALCLITYRFFVFDQRLVTFRGRSGLSVVTRLMGLILAVIGVRMLISGITGAMQIGQVPIAQPSGCDPTASAAAACTSA